MRDVHEATYLAFRDRLERMIANALAAAGKPHDTATTRALAIAGNALLDGLWIEASVLPDQFAQGEMRSIAIRAFARLLDLKLSE